MRLRSSKIFQNHFTGQYSRNRKDGGLAGTLLPFSNFDKHQFAYKFEVVLMANGWFSISLNGAISDKQEGTSWYLSRTPPQTMVSFDFLIMCKNRAKYIDSAIVLEWSWHLLKNNSKRALRKPLTVVKFMSLGYIWLRNIFSKVSHMRTD